MRSFAFNVAYWVLSIGYTLAAVIAALAPGRQATGWIIRRYVKRMVQAMRLLAGIRIQYRGEDRLPQGAFILAAKHQSWGDGFSVYDRFEDLAFVTGDHLEKFPLMATVLRKLGAIVVNNCGGRDAREALKSRAADAHRDGRRILIYPEGNLAKVGEKFRYRSGVWHMYRDFDMPVVPVGMGSRNSSVAVPGCFPNASCGQNRPRLVASGTTGMSKSRYMCQTPER